MVLTFTVVELLILNLVPNFVEKSNEIERYFAMKIILP